MTRYWRIYREFLKSAFVRELEFKANFFAKVAQNMVWTAFFFLIILVIFRNTRSVAGWNQGQVVILGGTVFLISSLAQAFFFSLQEIPQQVRLGSLDFVVTRPVDSQFWVSVRRFNFDQVGSLLAAIAMLVWGASTAQNSIGPASVLAYLCSIACALVVFYSLNLALMTTGIWFVRVDNLWVLSESVTSVARYPIDIFPIGVQRGLTYFFPLALIATLPTRQLIGRFDAGMLELSLGWAIGSFVCARLFWRYAMRHYTSASS